MYPANFEKISLQDDVNTSHYYFIPEQCLYSTVTTKRNIRYYRCIENGCQCRAKINGDFFERTNFFSHNHTLHVVKFEYEFEFKKLRDKIKIDRRPMQVIYRETLRTLSAEVAGMMEWEYIRKILQRIRTKQMPLCKSLPEMVELLENNDFIYEVFGHVREKIFYFGAVRGQPVFANQEIVWALQQNFELFIDGTFGIVPFRANQLLVILGEVNGRPRPLIYAVMTGRSADDYEAVLMFARDAIFFSPDGSKQTPRTATCDFEQALRLALVKVWPNVVIVGCNFHFCQSLRRNASTFTELANKISGPSPHHSVLQMFMRISLLPLERVEAGVTALIAFINEDSNLREDFARFIDYFIRTWMKRFPKEHWVVSNRTRRTNNNLEGYNNKIKNMIILNPPVFVFLDSLLNLAYDASAKFHSHTQRGAKTPSDRSLLSEPLKRALEQLQRADLNELEFLKQLANKY